MQIAPLRSPLPRALVVLVLVGICCSAAADPLPNLSRGQTVYVPIYSHIYSGNREIRLYLAATLSIRNTDPGSPIHLLTVDYHDSKGQVIKRMIDGKSKIDPFASTRFVIGEADKSGGSGASFIVRWQANKPVNPPLIEAIMISTKSQSGVSFSSRGQVISEEQ